MNFAKNVMSIKCIEVKKNVSQFAILNDNDKHVNVTYEERIKELELLLAAEKNA